MVIGPTSASLIYSKLLGFKTICYTKMFSNDDVILYSIEYFKDINIPLIKTVNEIDDHMDFTDPVILEERPNAVTIESIFKNIC